MGAYMQKFGSQIFPNGEAVYTAIERMKSGDAAGFVGPDGYINMYPGNGTIYSYSFRGLGLTAFPTQDVWLPVGHLLAQKDQGLDGAGDYLIPLQFLPMPSNIRYWHRQIILLRETATRVQKRFEQFLAETGYAKMYKTKDDQQSSFLGAVDQIGPAVPANPPLIAGDLPGGGAPIAFNYDPGLIKLGADYTVSHQFYRAITGVNPLVTSPLTQADMNANITP